MRLIAIWGVFVRHLITIKRTPLGQNDLWVWPAVDVLLIGSVGVFMTQESADPLRFKSILLGVFMFTLVQESSLALSISFMDETRSRNVLNLFASPIKGTEYWMGTAMAAVLRVLVAASVSSLACVAFYDFNPVTVGWAMPLVIALITVIGFAISSMLIALQLRIGSSADNLTWVIAIVPASISGAFVPLSALPGLFQTIAQVLPTTHAFAAARSIVAGDAFPARDMGIALLGFGFTAALFGAFSLRMISTFRRRGLITRYS